MRLLIITQFLGQEQIDVCFLRGARWPAGASIPDSVSFQWMGNPSSGWASIGALVSKNVLGSVQQVGILDFERSMWLDMKCIDRKPVLPGLNTATLSLFVSKDNWLVINHKLLQP